VIGVEENILPFVHAGAARDETAGERIEREDEELRLFYVAITRAEDECYIAGVKPARQRIDNSWYNLCHQAIKAIEGVTEDAGTYRVTSKQSKPVEKKTEDMAIGVALPGWATLPIEHEVKEAFFSPSRLISSELALYDKTGGDARTRGVLIHQLLELASGNPDKSTLEKLTRFIAPDWNNAERDAMVRDVQALLTNTDLSWIWSNEGYNEVSVSGVIDVNGQPQRMNGQIDRLVIHGNHIVVLDYKTSANFPKTIAETKPAYLLQMKAYRELLTSKYNGKTIRCGLLWTHAPRLDWLDELLDGYAWEQPRQVA
jgi:ATP-dependent helicase/nuclease subunit A